MNWSNQRLALAAALGLTLAACGGGGGGGGGGGDQTPEPNEPEQPEEPQEPEPEPTVLERVRFITMGDSGSGSDGAFAVGQAIADVCAAKAGADNQPERAGCDFVVGLGDNIYEAGVTSVDDPQFAEKFEKPFEPVQLPFYMVLGNHDNTGYVGGDGAGNARGEFQVDYTYFDGRLSDRWKMPDRYFQHDEGETADGRPLVSLFALDSNPIAGGFADADLDYAYHTYGINQLNWTVSAVGGSQAEFKIAMAHHPYLSNGSHGNAGNYDGVPSEILPVLAGTAGGPSWRKRCATRPTFSWPATTTTCRCSTRCRNAAAPNSWSAAPPAKPVALMIPCATRRRSSAATPTVSSGWRRWTPTRTPALRRDCAWKPMWWTRTRTTWACSMAPTPRRPTRAATTSSRRPTWRRAMISPATSSPVAAASRCLCRTASTRISAARCGRSATN